MNKVLLLLAVMLPILGAILWGTWPAFAAYAGEMSIHGWVALAAGTLLSLALGGGLMALSFYSARRGYDERAQWEEGAIADEGDEPPPRS